MTKLLRFLRPSHQHTAFSATLLLMGTVMLSRVIGYAREAYIAFAFGAGSQTDAYVAAFTLPDFLNYIVAGGAASITFISIYTRFLAEKRDADAQKTFSIIITVMTAVMIVGTIITELFAPQFVRWFVKGFSPDQIDLCVQASRRESMSNSVLEAMARGIPCITTDVGGMPELIENGQSGLIAAAGRPDSLAAAIRELTADSALYMKIGEAARRRIQERFRIEDVRELTVRAILGHTSRHT